MDISDKIGVYYSISLHTESIALNDCFSKYDLDEYEIAYFAGNSLNLMKSNLVEYKEYEDKYILHFYIPSSVGGCDIVDLTSIAHLAGCAYIREYKPGKLVVLDYSDCDLSNIIWANNLFTTNFDLIEVKLPDGSKRLRPISVWRHPYSEIVNIDYAIRKTDLSATISFKLMFYNCDTIKEVDMRGKKIDNCVDVSSMFSRCSKLEHVKFDKGQLRMVKNAESMFNGCKSLVEFDMECFGDNCLSDIRFMFCKCSNLKSVTCNWDSAVNKYNINMDGAFSGCRELTDLDVNSILGLVSTQWGSYKVIEECKKLNLRNLCIINDNREIVESSLIYTEKNMLDIRGTRLLINGKNVAISIIGSSCHNDAYFSGGNVVILDKEQYYENKMQVDRFIRNTNSEIEICGREALECFLLKIRCFGIESLDRTIVIVDTDYEIEV